MSMFRGRGQPKTSKPNQQATTQVLPESAWEGDALPSGIPPAESVVVTISREFGSGGAEIGRIIAQESNLTYIDF